MTTIEPWKKKLALWATNSRFVVALLIFAIIYSPLPHKDWITAIVFMLGSITDWLDGYWARKYQAESVMGKFMDPIADKVLVLAALVILVHQQKIDPFAPALLLSRDIFIGGIRSIAAANQIIIDAKATGKWKTGFQMVAIPCLFIQKVDPIPFDDIGKATLWVSVILSAISGIQYTKLYFQGAKKA